jgi:hypothetical protein
MVLWFWRDQKLPDSSTSFTFKIPFGFSWAVCQTGPWKQAVMGVGPGPHTPGGSNPVPQSTRERIPQPQKCQGRLAGLACAVGVLLGSDKNYLVHPLGCKAVATSETRKRSAVWLEAIRESAEVLRWCPGAESNHRHRDFQSRSLIDRTTTYKIEMCLTAHQHSMR